MDTFLKIRGLKKHFGHNCVLDGVDLDVAKGSVTTIIGKSGIGKSVLLKCIAKLLDADAGTIELDNQSIFSKPKLTQGNAMNFSYMFQNNALFDSLTIFDNVALPLREASNLSERKVIERTNTMLENLELSDSAKNFPGQISGGMKKRVALGRALITEPRMVLFDEPTTGLDPERKYSVFEMIADYRKRFDFTALLVSHDIPEVFEISDQVAWLDGGSIKFYGSPEDLNIDAKFTLSGFLNTAKYGRNDSLMYGNRK